MGAISIVFPLGQVVVGLGLMFGNGAASYPVSYTHLDVYKRQAAFRNKTGRQPEKGSGPQPTTRNGGLTMNFSVEEENLIGMYHTSDRRRTMARMLAALPDMDTEMRRLANGTIAKLEHMTDADFRCV